MKKKMILTSVVCLISLTSCKNTGSAKSPEYHSQIVMDEYLNIENMGHSGEFTPDGDYYYYGSVTLYSDDGNSKTFDCYQGTEGLEKGCRGVLCNRIFYNLDRNQWVTINGIKYKGSLN